MHQQNNEDIIVPSPVHQSIQEDDTTSVRPANQEVPVAKRTTETAGKFLNGWGIIVVLWIWSQLIYYFPNYAHIDRPVSLIISDSASIFGALVASFATRKFVKEHPKAIYTDLGRSISFSVFVAFALIVLEITIDTTNPAPPQFIAIPLRVCLLIIAMGWVLIVVYTLHYVKITKEDIQLLKDGITIKNVILWTLAVIGGVTTIISFLNALIPLITGKH